MIEWGDAEYYRPLARCAHFGLSALSGSLAYYAIGRTCSASKTRTLSWLMRWACSLSAALWAHWIADVYLRIP